MALTLEVRWLCTPRKVTLTRALGQGLNVSVELMATQQAVAPQVRTLSPVLRGPAGPGATVSILPDNALKRDEQGNLFVEPPQWKSNDW